MTAALLVALGGALGTAGRYASGLFAKHHFGESLPVATLFVNVLGSFLLAALASTLGDREWLGVPLRLTLGTGVLGGFTTYSSFNLEVLALYRDGQAAHAAAYLALTLVLCLAGGVAGLALGGGRAS